MLLRGGTVVDLDGERPADVLVGSDGRIAAVGPDLSSAPGFDPATAVVDVPGRLVVPGGIDAHTHLHLPVGAVHVSDDFASGTVAAAIGGTTTVIDYVTAYRGEDPLAALGNWRALAEPAAVDYGLHMTFTEAVGEGVVADCVERGVTSFKLYLAYPELLQVDDDVVFDVLRAATPPRRAGHGALRERRRHRGAAAPGAGRGPHRRRRARRPPGLRPWRPRPCTGWAGWPRPPARRVYVVHLSSAPGLAEVRAAQERGVALQAETCPQYLHLDAAVLEGPAGENFVCTPPLRDPWHREELWEGLARGWVQTVATDHCPFWQADRRRGTAGRDDGFADFTEIPGGLPGIETRMTLVWQGVRAGRISVADWVRLCAEAPASTFGLFPRKGCLRPGSDADVVVWDPERPQSLDAAALHMRTDHSPYEGRVVRGWPELVLSRGRVVARDGRFQGEPGWGRYVERT